MIDRLIEELKAVPGGYEYLGAASVQICFPLKAGGELRFGLYDDGDGEWHFDFYSGECPPGITGPVTATGAV